MSLIFLRYNLAGKGGKRLMKATGVVRRIDTLGRIVIPKEVRRNLRIRDGDSLEIFVDTEGEVILKKHSPFSKLKEFAKEYADSLHDAIRHIACITDRDQVIAVSGGPKREFLNKRLGAAVEKAMANRKAILITQPGRYPFFNEEEDEFRYTAEVIAPIIAEGDAIGAVIIVSREPNIRFGELELKSAVTAASFLAKQMEQ
jgi:AbrB family transcriptional regulator (stage V sporulation protein T)